MNRARALDPRTHALGLLAAPAFGVLVGLGAVLVADRGAGHRPALSALVLVAAVAAGLSPLRYGLPLAILLAGFEGFMDDLAGGAALYWNEVFVALIVVRSLLVRRPSQLEILAWAAVAAVFLGYLATGSKAVAVLWGAKVFATSLLAGWALARMRGLGVREWCATFYGLAALVAASLVVAGWERHAGPERLGHLGLLSSGGGPRLTANGAVRAFAGFSSAAPFSYALALAALCWLGVAAGGRRHLLLAAGTAWLPVGSVVGIAWAHDRLAAVALVAAAAIAGTVHALRRQPGLLGLATAVLVAAAVGLFASSTVRQHLHTASTFRTSLWREYLRELTAGGAGPATAGSAFPHGGFPRWVDPVRFPSGWSNVSVDHGAVYRRMETRGIVLVTAPDVPRRPTLLLAGRVESL